MCVWQAFELQVATSGAWKTITSSSSNNLDVTKYLGPAVAGSVLRIRMTKVPQLLLNGARLQIPFSLFFLCAATSNPGYQ